MQALYQLSYSPKVAGWEASSPEAPESNHCERYWALRIVTAPFVSSTRIVTVALRRPALTAQATVDSGGLTSTLAFPHSTAVTASTLDRTNSTNFADESMAIPGWTSNLAVAVSKLTT